MVVFLGKGSALWREVVGLCPGCPEGGERVEGGCTLLLVTCPSWKRVEILAISAQVLGSGSSSLLLIMMVPGPPCPFSFSVVVMGRCDRQGPITNSSSENETLHLSKKKVTVIVLIKLL
jgi:hypothetical protein